MIVNTPWKSDIYNFYIILIESKLQNQVNYWFLMVFGCALASGLVLFVGFLSYQNEFLAVIKHLDCS